jgi:hypothetical protein
MKHEWETSDIYKKYSSEDLKEKDHVWDENIDGY